MKEKHDVVVSVGSVFNMRPFFVKVATEKEKMMCMHKECLNIRLEFNAVMEHSKKNDGPFFLSLTEFFMPSCNCPRSANGYFKQECCQGLCVDCKDYQMPEIPKLKENISYYLFEAVKHEYRSKKTGEMVKTSRTERVKKESTVEELCKTLKEKRNRYLYHRYQIENDNFIWRKVIETVEPLGNIYWMDYSENLSGTPKYEPQDAHFSKKQFTLHCTVGYTKLGIEYLYHISNDTIHDSHHTFAVVEHILYRSYKDSKIFRFKSDNCPTQYKCCNVFSKWRRLSTAYQKVIIVYYGISGHGKGLVDAMSSFGVKATLQKAIVQKDFFFNEASDIKTYLQTEMVDSTNKHYYEIEEDSLVERRSNDNEQLKIDNCMKKHMFAYFPDGTIQVKENLCSCKDCIEGKFTNCKIEKGVLIGEEQMEDGDNEVNDDEGNTPDEDCDNDNEDFEVNDLIRREESIFSCIIEGSYVAVYSDTNANEIFYVCKVNELKIADEDMIDEFEHSVSKGSRYLSCNYLEKIDENHRKREVMYKLIKGTVVVHPNQVFHPSVELSDKLKMKMEQYFELGDCMYR